MGQFSGVGKISLELRSKGQPVRPCSGQARAAVRHEFYGRNYGGGAGGKQHIIWPRLSNLPLRAER